MLWECACFKKNIILHRKKIGFGTSWGLVNDEWTLIFGQTVPLSLNTQNVKTMVKKYHFSHIKWESLLK